MPVLLAFSFETESVLTITGLTVVSAALLRLVAPRRPKDHDRG
ncbi:MAG: hypothetical protein R2694_02855 [Ilumatobacteraceae bacterium]|mgnify:CR=1 FL=1